MIFLRVDHLEIIPRYAEWIIGFNTNILNLKIKSRNAVKKPPVKGSFAGI
jgi:hypothetical protein